MKPIIILPPNTMTDENIQLLRDNDLCVVVAEDPAAVKFIDPLPTMLVHQIYSLLGDTKLTVNIKGAAEMAAAAKLPEETK